MKNNRQLAIKNLKGSEEKNESVLDVKKYEGE